ncbi:hypothetical protein [Pseudomonas sp.]|uniref:hypothetical protein n=1 Tax=Pseudomonas sp. TaxID=306 RepID=UPI0025827BA3|nr:hypothetical protein [Pseudomonas sp.]
MSQQEYTGGSVSYYTVRVEQPTNADAAPYSAECNDIIEALGMNYAEGNAFKALWRRCAARNLGLAKHGYKDGLYDAEKVVFFGQRMVALEQYKRDHCGGFDQLVAELQVAGDWPDETRRQDAQAEDEAFAAIQPYTGQGGVMLCLNHGRECVSCECRP